MLEPEPISGSLVPNSKAILPNSNILESKKAIEEQSLTLSKKGGLMSRAYFLTRLPAHYWSVANLPLY